MCVYMCVYSVLISGATYVFACTHRRDESAMFIEIDVFN